MKKKVQWNAGVVPHRVAVRKNPPKVEWQKKPLSEELKYQPYYTSDDASDIRPGDLFVLQDDFFAWLLDNSSPGYRLRRYPLLAGSKTTKQRHDNVKEKFFLYVGQHCELTSSISSDAPVMCVFPAFLVGEVVMSIPCFRSFLRKIS